MSAADQDRELRLRFARLRGADERHHRVFAALLASPPRHERPRRSPFVRAALIGAALLVVTRLGVLTSGAITGDDPGGRAERPVIDLGAEVWTAPTDFLLRTPGAEMLQTVPSFALPAIPPSREPDRGDTAIRRRNDS